MVGRKEERRDWRVLRFWDVSGIGAEEDDEDDEGLEGEEPEVEGDALCGEAGAEDVDTERDELLAGEEEEKEEEEEAMLLGRV